MFGNDSFKSELWSTSDIIFVSVGCIAISVVGLISLLLFVGWRVKKSNNHKNGGIPVSQAGILRTVLAMGGDEGPWFLLEQAEKLQSKVFRLNMPVPGGFYVVGDLHLTNEILKDATTSKPRFLMKSFDPINGAGKDGDMFSSETNEHWKRLRKGSAPAFSTNQVARMNEICMQNVEAWIRETLEPLATTGESFDPSEHMLYIAFKLICEAGFEYQVTQEEMRDFKHNADLALTEYGFKQAVNPLRGIFGFMIPEVRRAQEACRKLQAFGRMVLESYRNNPNKSKQNTLIRLLTENPVLKSNEADLVAEVIAFLLAGHETTAHTITAAMIQLAKHPHVAKKLRQDLLTTDDKDKKNDYRNSPYLQQVLRESNRITPVAAMASIRSTGRAFEFCPSHDTTSTSKGGQSSPWTIPKDAVVLFPHILLNYDALVFPDPQRFDPDRWNATNITPAMRETALLMFSAGNRNCVGQNLAIAELNSVVPRLIQAFDFELVDEGTLSHFATLKHVGARIKVSRAVPAK